MRPTAGNSHLNTKRDQPKQAIMVGSIIARVALTPPRLNTTSSTTAMEQSNRYYHKATVTIRKQPRLPKEATVQ
ncbi:hypothetical protein MY8738_010193, partial [Beauveria namnaoensis]